MRCFVSGYVDKPYSLGSQYGISHFLLHLVNESDGEETYYWLTGNWHHLQVTTRTSEGTYEAKPVIRTWSYFKTTAPAATELVQEKEVPFSDLPFDFRDRYCHEVFADLPQSDINLRVLGVERGRQYNEALLRQDFTLANTIAGSFYHSCYVPGHFDRWAMKAKYRSLVNNVPFLVAYALHNVQEDEEANQILGKLHEQKGTAPEDYYARPYYGKHNGEHIVYAYLSKHLTCRELMEIFPQPEESLDEIGYLCSYLAGKPVPYFNIYT